MKPGWPLRTIGVLLRNAFLGGNVVALRLRCQPRAMADYMRQCLFLFQAYTSTRGLRPKLIYTGGERGWIGDNPFIFLDTAKIRALGWQPKLSIREGIIRTLDYLQANAWVLGTRA